MFDGRVAKFIFRVRNFSKQEAQWSDGIDIAAVRVVREMVD